MRPVLFALTLALAPLPAASDTLTNHLFAMLATIPDFGPQPGLTIGFGDPATVRGLDFSAVEGADTDPVMAQLRGFPAGNLTMTLRDPASDWRGAVGFGPGDIRQMLEVAAPPLSALVLALEPKVTPAIPPALEALDHQPTARGAATVWARGEDFAIDLRARNPDDPFGGGMGRSSRVHLQGGLLRQTTAWSALDAMLQPDTPRMVENADLVAILDTLDQLAPEGVLAQAVIMPDAASLGLTDPMAVLTGRAAAPAGPAPAWRMAVFADVTTGPVSTGILALTVTLPDADAARALADHVARAWEERLLPQTTRSFAGLTGASADVRYRRAGADLWVLLVAGTGQTEPHGRGLTRGRVYNFLNMAAMRRELVFLQP